MEWHISKPDPKRKKYQIRGELWNGQIVKLPGHRDKKIAEMIRDNVASLNRSKLLGELPDPRLKDWIAGLPDKDAEQYVKFGLMPRRLLDRGMPIQSLINEFAMHIQARCENRSRWAKQWPLLVHRLVDEIGKNTKNAKQISFDQLDEDSVNIALKGMLALGGRRKGQPISQKTKREYMFAIKSFGDWMVKKRGALTNPFSDLNVPSAKGAPVLNRRPMQVGEFEKLADYLLKAPSKYSHQIIDWKPEDRLMIYWTAVLTGLRANELRSLTVGSVDFDANPVLITVEGWVAKNRTKASVPVTDAAFINKLRGYTSQRPPNVPLLKIPCQSALTSALYRDLDAAGVQRKFNGNKVIDFHTLRSTAMYWWLTKDRLDLLKVQRRARLKTLALVQEYVKNHAPEYED